MARTIATGAVMKWFGHIQSVYVHRQPVDFRQSIDGLAQIVQQQMPNSVWAGSAFVFCNRHYDRLKILCWDETGFVLWYKRLERDQFQWPRKSSETVLNLSVEQLDWLLKGLDILASKPHKKVEISANCC
jgi:transposase